MKDLIIESINNSIQLKEALIEDQNAHIAISNIAESFFQSILSGGKILICGNGGSAADAQHFAAELVGRFMKERESIAALALTTDSSILTAIGNDYGFDQVFSRQIQGLCNKEDSLLVISTSGNSVNIIKAIEEAKKKHIYVAALLGKKGGRISEMVDDKYIVPFNESARIQEVHLLIEHIICDIIETKYVSKK